MSCCFSRGDRVKPMQQRQRDDKPGGGDDAAASTKPPPPRPPAVAVEDIDDGEAELLPTVLSASTAEERAAELSSATAQVEAFQAQAMEGLAALQKLKAAGPAAGPAAGGGGGGVADPAVVGLRPSERPAPAPGDGPASDTAAAEEEEPLDDASVTELLELQAQANAALAAMAALQDMHMQALGAEAVEAAA
jgi:hypothetical protein